MKRVKAVRLNCYKSSCIDYVVRLWVKNSDYWDVYSDMNEHVRESFQRNGIAMTCEHLKVHIEQKQPNLHKTGKPRRIFICGAFFVAKTGRLRDLSAFIFLHTAQTGKVSAICAQTVADIEQKLIKPPAATPG